MKRLTVGIIVALWVALVTGIMYPSIMYRVGIYLVVDEESGPVEVLVASHLDQKTLNYYRTGKCKKIYLILKESHENVWKAIYRLKRETNLRKIAIGSGMDPSDLVVIKKSNDYQGKKSKYIYDLLKEHGVQSALVLARFYKTRRYRSDFDRFVDGDVIRISVQPTDSLYRDKLHRWWEKTTYANYFLSEYLRMFYYYFNRLLLTDLFYVEVA